MDLADARALWYPEPGWLNTASYGLPPKPAWDDAAGRRSTDVAARRPTAGSAWDESTAAGPRGVRPPRAVDDDP